MTMPDILITLKMRQYETPFLKHLLRQSELGLSDAQPIPDDPFQYFSSETVKAPSPHLAGRNSVAGACPPLRRRDRRRERLIFRKDFVDDCSHACRLVTGVNHLIHDQVPKPFVARFSVEFLANKPFACPSIRCTALTLARTLTARLAAVCLKSCGVMVGNEWSAA
jgi:hypothetical protein